MSVLKAALAETNITIRKYDPTKMRPVYTDRTSLSVSKFTDDLIRAIPKKSLEKYPEIIRAINDITEMISLIEEYADSEGLKKSDEISEVVIPEELKSLRLNVDRSSKEQTAKRFFCTTPDELVDQNTSGFYYIEACGVSFAEANRMARAVVPRYIPRNGVRGVREEKDKVTGMPTPFFNTYIPPEWQVWMEKNPKSWAKLPAKPPEEIMRFLKHLIPNKKEREYFYAWTYTSMMSRSFVYLVLCGNPGVGKNRLKILLRALHGRHNSVDGKKETFGANENKFNSQMLDNTLLWFDELKYGPDMEPRMKEYQNTNISIEKKGVDATASSDIYSSMVISNNYPRDNYILFNSRKFAPLVLGEAPLTAAMTSDEIFRMSARLDNTGNSFDVKYAAQIAKWILSIGEKYVPQFPNLEYQGPKYWELAHTSMSRWQKIAVMALTTETRLGKFPGWDETKGAFLWSKVEEALRRKKEYESKDYRDASTVKAFFQTYCDEKGQTIFETEDVPGSIVQDFWIKTLSKFKKVASVTLGDQEKVVERKEKQKTEKSDGLVRPPGITQYQWRKMKEEYEASQSGKINGKEIDDL